MPLSPLVAARRALVSLLLAFARAYNFTVDVNRDSEDKEVKAAVRKACRHVHPDKGGSTADQSRLNVERARVRLSTAAFLRTGTLEYRYAVMKVRSLLKQRQKKTHTHKTRKRRDAQTHAHTDMHTNIHKHTHTNSNRHHHCANMFVNPPPHPPRILAEFFFISAVRFQDYPLLNNSISL